MHPHAAIRLFITHDRVDQRTKATLAPWLKRGLVDMHRYQRHLRYVLILKHWWRDTPDAVVINYNATAQYLIGLLPRTTRVLHIIHGVTSDFGRIASIWSKRVDCYVAPSTRAVEMCRYHAPSVCDRPIKIIQHGLQRRQNLIDTWLNKREQFSSTRPLRVMFAGVLEPHKRPGELVKIAELLRDASLNIQFEISVFGDGSMLRDLKNIIHTKGLDSFVLFHGRVRHEELLKEYPRHEILLSTSLTESFGLVIAEAMMCGCVPIAAEIKGVTTELIQDNITGFITREGPDEMAVRIAELARNPDKLFRMAMRAQAHARDNFSLDKMAEQYLALLTPRRQER